jgi:hypothetical protein
VRKLAIIEITFYSNGVWESNSPERVAGGGNADSMLWFWLERRGDEVNHCQKMKRRQQAYLGSMGRKRDTTCAHVATSTG